MSTNLQSRVLDVQSYFTGIMSGTESEMEGEGGTQWGVILTMAGVGVAVVGFLIYCICRSSSRDRFENA